MFISLCYVGLNLWLVVNETKKRILLRTAGLSCETYS